MRNTFKSLFALNLITIVDRVLEVFSTTRYDKIVDSDFNELYKWKTLNDALSEAYANKKPVFLLVYRYSCPACQELKEKLSKSIRIQDLSKHFVMVNAENSVKVLNRDEKFYPDGKYVPRILFFTPDGELIKEAHNRSSQSHPEYRYYYSSPAPIINTMLFVLSQYNTLRPVNYERHIKSRISELNDIEVPKSTDNRPVILK